MDAISGYALQLFSWWDAAALAAFLLAWGAMTPLIERAPPGRASVHVVMQDFRRRWMQELARRENRMLDASLLIALRQGAAFFASGVLVAVGGLVALLGQAERLVSLARDVTPLEVSRVAWEAKLLVILVVLVNAFLKFVWSHRLFGYCAIVIGAVPVDPDHPDTARTVERAAQLNITAARSFNRGLRTVYFAMALLAWFLGPLALVAATLTTAAMLYRREFRSASRAALIGGGAAPPG